MTDDTSSALSHPRALAHLGDAVYELWVRELAITQSQNVNTLHKYTTERVKAETQVKLLDLLIPTLGEDELALIKRAQNMPVTASRRSNQALYRKSTGFEALIGFWHQTLCAETLGHKKAQVLDMLQALMAK